MSEAPAPTDTNTDVSQGARGVACVMVNYGAAALVAAHLGETLAALRAVPTSRLFVVDNASPGGDAEVLAPALAAHDDAELIAHDANDGFAAGNNLGLAAMRAAEGARGRRFAHVLFLNPDAWPEPDAVSRLVAFAEARPEAGLFGPAITSEGGKVHWSAFRFPTLLGEVEGRAATGAITRLLRRHVVSPPPPATARRTDWVSGAALMMRREVVETLGPMDEGYFLYFEETDYQLAAARAGFECWYVPEARVTHLEGASTGQGKAAADESDVPDYWFRSRRRYLEKNHGAAYADRADRAWLAATRFHVARQRLLGRSDGGRSAAIERFLANRGVPGRGKPGEAVSGGGN